MKLDQLLECSGSQVEITALAYDSRLAAPGTLFFCVPGFEQDGHDYAADAVARGASALVVERALGLGVPEAVVPSSRAAMAGAAARFYGDPTASLQVVGVTGTNGKTTSAFLVRELLEAAGRQTALLGTVKAVIGGADRPVQRTTAEAIDLQRDFSEMLRAGDRACALEVSSHALELHRVDAVHYAAAIFTNLTQDHLDFHSDMESYFQAKRRLFAGDRAPTVAVLNIDDPYGRRLAAEFPAARTFGRGGHYAARGVSFTISGARFQLEHPGGSCVLNSPLPGAFNVSNVLGAVAAVNSLGVPLEVIARALPGVAAVPGRFQPIVEGQPFAVLVDYAHTPDSLENVLNAARTLTERRLVCVFGCGGDRDRGKRPQMGRIAAELADEVIVTSDNPRSERPEEIVAQIVKGAGSAAIAMIDRRAAIEFAVEGAGPGDVVVIAGKGHEQGQQFADGLELPFDDAAVAREALRKCGAAP